MRLAFRRTLPLIAAALLLSGPASTLTRAAPGDDLEPTPAAAEGDEEALLEFHFTPVDNLQIAIWLEDAEGNFLQDVFVTQATGKLGIGNRSGDFLFLSSWRAPYGARDSVLPVWAHRRGRTYPKIIFHDSAVSNHTSLGFHEASSSPETYFCRPLTPTEDAAIIDTMSCPSPATFQSDKGEFAGGGLTSVYPPRNDLTAFEEGDDSEDIKLYAELNDLDAVTRATPKQGPYLFAHRLRRDEVPEGPLVAWIEVSLEWDENADWEFDREDDHWVDPKLAAYGREFLGQPAVVYRVEFDPAVEGFTSVTQYAGYADWDGATGMLHMPDATISTSGGSGADRLQVREMFGVPARFGVYNHGWQMPGEPGDGDGDGDGDTGGGGCSTFQLPPVEDLRLEPIDFDSVRASFRLPAELSPNLQLGSLLAWYKTPETTEFDPAASTEVPGLPRLCSGTDEVDCIEAGPGDEVRVEIDELFGNYTYTIGVTYEDACTNRAPVVFTDVTTPVQPFQTIDGACFIATAAWGAGWTEELRALRWLRDSALIGHPIGDDLVRSYYSYGPQLAKLIADVPPARATVRWALQPIAKLSRRALELHERRAALLGQAR